jgi:hypothetical protein
MLNLDTKMGLDYIASEKRVEQGILITEGTINVSLIITDLNNLEYFRFIEKLPIDSSSFNNDLEKYKNTLSTRI